MVPVERRPLPFPLPSTSASSYALPSTIGISTGGPPPPPPTMPRSPSRGPGPPLSTAWPSRGGVPLSPFSFPPSPPTHLRRAAPPAHPADTRRLRTRARIPIQIRTPRDGRARRPRSSIAPRQPHVRRSSLHARAMSRADSRRGRATRTRRRPLSLPPGTPPRFAGGAGQRPGAVQLSAAHCV